MNYFMDPENTHHVSIALNDVNTYRKSTHSSDVVKSEIYVLAVRVESGQVGYF